MVCLGSGGVAVGVREVCAICVLLLCYLRDFLPFLVSKLKIGSRAALMLTSRAFG